LVAILYSNSSVEELDPRYPPKIYIFPLLYIMQDAASFLGEGIVPVGLIEV